MRYSYRKENVVLLPAALAQSQVNEWARSHKYNLAHNAKNDYSDRTQSKEALIGLISWILRDEIAKYIVPSGPMLRFGRPERNNQFLEEFTMHKNSMKRTGGAAPMILTWPCRRWPIWGRRVNKLLTDSVKAKCIIISFLSRNQL